MPDSPAVDVHSLPPLDTPFELPPGASERYLSSGHAIVRALASASEVAAYRPAIAGATAALNPERRSLGDRDTYGKAFLQTMNLWRHDDAVRRFVTARRFARVAAELMGVPGVRLYHDQSLFKEPNGGRTPWHQDQFYWPLDTDRTITMWMPLMDVTADMGITQFATGSHRRGRLDDLPIGDESEEKLAAYVADRRFEIAGGKALGAGDATFHSGWTLHAAPPNRSGRMREVMTVIYFADGGRVTQPRDPFQEMDLACWLPGLRPGDLAASDGNPLLHPG